MTSGGDPEPINCGKTAATKLHRPELTIYFQCELMAYNPPPTSEKVAENSAAPSSGSSCPELAISQLTKRHIEAH